MLAFNATRFEDFLANVMQSEKIPGVAVGLAWHGEAIYAAGFGSADLPTGRPMTPNTLCGIASISKSFAALAVAQLVEKGLVDPFAPVVAYVPEFRLPMASDMAKILVHHCLSHTTGTPPLQRRQGEFREFGEHLAYLAQYETPPLGHPGQYLSYCNDTFMLAGAIVERVTGRQFRDYVRSEIIDPLGLGRTTYESPATGAWEDVTTLYNPAKEEGGAPQPQPWPDLGTYHVGGGIRSTVYDLLRYGDMYAREGLGHHGTRIIPRAGVLRMRMPVAPVLAGGYYCYGLQTTPAYHGITLVEHGGSLPGVASHWGYLSQVGVSAVVLTNLRGAPSSLLWTGLINTALGLPPEQPRHPSPPTYSVDQEHLARMAGDYRSDEGALVTIDCTNGQLTAEVDGAHHDLRVTAADQAVYASQSQEKPIRFHLPSDGGAAWALTTGVRMIRRAP